MRSKRVISYIDEARPLSFEQLQRDIRSTFTRDAQMADEFLMWEHQLDWLLKLTKAPPLNGRTEYGHYLVREKGSWSWQPGSGLNTIWGIPVEVISP